MSGPRGEPRAAHDQRDPQPDVVGAGLGAVAAAALLALVDPVVRRERDHGVVERAEHVELLDHLAHQAIDRGQLAQSAAEGLLDQGPLLVGDRKAVLDPGGLGLRVDHRDLPAAGAGPGVEILGVRGEGRVGLLRGEEAEPRTRAADERANLPGQVVGLEGVRDLPGLFLLAHHPVGCGVVLGQLAPGVPAAGRRDAPDGRGVLDRRPRGGVLEAGPRSVPEVDVLPEQAGAVAGFGGPRSQRVVVIVERRHVVAHGELAVIPAQLSGEEPHPVGLAERHVAAGTGEGAAWVLDEASDVGHVRHVVVAHVVGDDHQEVGHRGSSRRR